jgi:glycine oxidase
MGAHRRSSLAGQARATSINLVSIRSEPTDVAVVGGGIIGLAVAWCASQRDMDVTVLERGRAGEGASRVAAGMLAPVSEVEFGAGGRRLLELGLRSADLWPRFAAELEQLTGRQLGLSESGALLVAVDDDEAAELERQISLRESLGMRARRLRPSDARGLEPALAPVIRLALEIPDDRAVDPRAAVAALRSACASSGVKIREGAPVAGLLFEGGRIGGVELAGGERLTADRVVAAAGAWTSSLPGLPAGVGVPVRPVKGQTLRLRDPSGPGLLRRPLRSGSSYLVPRADGRYVLGGTVEERGFDDAPTVLAAYELLRDARELVPGVSELEIEELCVGLRPGTPDNLPAIGEGAAEGLVWATGHFRNGILLAPLTGELVAALLAGERPDERSLEICSPLRFASGGPGTAETKRDTPAAVR